MTLTPFFRLLKTPIDAKGAHLAEQIQALNAGQPAPDVFTVDPADFNQIPGSPFAYWTQERIRSLFSEMQSLENNARHVGLGLSTKDDKQFVRLWWEVSPSVIGYMAKWCSYANGSSYRPFYCDHATIVLRENDFDQIKQNVLKKYPYLGNNADWIIHSENDYISPGIGWPLRTHSFCPQVLPTGFVFSARTYALVTNRLDLLWLLGYLSSTFSDYLMKLSLGRFGYPEFVTGVVRNLPIVEPTSSEQKSLAQMALSTYQTYREFDLVNETSHFFTKCVLAEPSGKTLTEIINNFGEFRARKEFEIASYKKETDRIVVNLYGLDYEEIADEIDQFNSPEDLLEESGIDEVVEADDTVSSDAVADNVQVLLSWAIGCILGRWDIRFAFNSTLLPQLQDPFDPLSVCSPGTLVGPDGLPARKGTIVSEDWLRARPNVITLPAIDAARATISDSAYPLKVDWDGIIVDDADHRDDIVRRVRDVLALLWGDRADAIEDEACSILGVNDLRDYFRQPKFFFDFHIKRYSKSRRKAPIYWLLQSSKKNYGLWLYYHRFDRDLLYKALALYTEPKLSLEKIKLGDLRDQLASAAEARERRSLEKAIVKQEAFIVELTDFRNELERVARLDLTPDFNDGVIISIAPLHNLVPWKEADRLWAELEQGKYEWSTMSRLMKERGLLKPTRSRA